METIKNYLKKTGMSADENQITDFLEANENEIKSFLADLWKDQVAKPAEEALQIEAAGEQPAAAASEPAAAASEPVAAAEAPKISTEAPKDMAKFGAATPLREEQVKQEVLQHQIKSKQITFANGKVNQPYEVDFDVEKLQMPEIAEVSFEKLEAIGLQYFPEEQKIKGVPTKAGDHKVEMKFKRKDWEVGKPLLSREVMFIINPDPRELWSKNIPTDKAVEYYKPDSDKAFLKVEPKTVKDGFLGLGKKEIPRKSMVAASQRGRSHAIEGKPRDDDFALHFDSQTEWYVMVVADGAGSASYSRKGSQVACQTAKEVCANQLAKEGLSDVLDWAIGKYAKDKSEKNRADLYRSLHSEILAKAAWAAKIGIEKEAASNRRSPKEYATTLLISICKKFDFGWFVGAFWVGDGGIGIYRKEPQRLKILGEPDGGEFAGQTRFLTMPEVFSDRVRTRFEIVEDFTAVVLMSDGVTDPKFETDANLNKIEKWNALWDDLNGHNEDSAKVSFLDSSEQSADQLLRWLDFWSKGNHDDRTIAILF